MMLWDLNCLTSTYDCLFLPRASQLGLISRLTFIHLYNIQIYCKPQDLQEMSVPGSIILAPFFTLFPFLLFLLYICARSHLWMKLWHKSLTLLYACLQITLGSGIMCFYPTGRKLAWIFAVLLCSVNAGPAALIASDSDNRTGCLIRFSEDLLLYLHIKVKGRSHIKWNVALLSESLERFELLMESSGFSSVICFTKYIRLCCVTFILIGAYTLLSQ